MKDQVVVITGASSGIGASLAKSYAKRGARLALLARRKEKLTDIARECGDASPIACDVNDDASVEKAFREVVAIFGKIDVVIANAGISIPGTIEKSSVEDIRKQLDTNVLGAVRTAKAAIAFLRATRGRLGIVGSLNGYLSLPGFAGYAMSKFAVRALCDALRGELRKDGISVTHLAPGFVESEIRLKDGVDPVPGWLVMSGENAANEIVNAVSRRRGDAVITGHGRAFVALQRRAPKLFDKLVELNAERIVSSFD